MLAKCSRCSQTFQTDRFGEQFCPFCGAQVSVASPGGTGPTSGAPIPGGAPGAQDQKAPVDEPAVHGGWLNAAVATWKKSVFDPGPFFNRLVTGPDTGGALGYAVAILAIGGVFAGTMNLLQGVLQRNQLAEFQQQLANLPAEWRDAFQWIIHFIQPSPLAILWTPVVSIIAFFVNALLLHLALMIVGGNKSGFPATLRALGFAQGPQIFNVIPLCGGMAAGIWTLVLSVMGLAGVHRIGIGRVIGAYALLLVAGCCICAIPIGIIAGVAGSHLGGHGVYNVP